MHYIAVVVYTHKKCKVRKATVGKVPGSGEENQKVFLDQRKRAGKPTMKTAALGVGLAHAPPAPPPATTGAHPHPRTHTA